MKRFVEVVIVSWIVCMGHTQGLGAQPKHVVVEDARRSLAMVADMLPTFEASEYIYNRNPRREGWSRLAEANYEPEILVELLADPRPRVRTLAMALLFNKENPKLLMPVAFGLLSDTASTFPVLLPTDNADPLATAPQTVSDIAKQMLGAYLLAAGVPTWRNPKVVDWVEYDSSRRNRSYSLSWLVVRLCRITGMQSPFPEERRPLLLSFRKDLDSLPPECAGPLPHLALPREPRFRRRPRPGDGGRTC